MWSDTPVGSACNVDCELKSEIMDLLLIVLSSLLFVIKVAKVSLTYFD